MGKSVCICLATSVTNIQFEELKREALENSQRQRVELEEKLKERAKHKDDAQRAAEERERQRAAWNARERERQLKNESVMKKLEEKRAEAAEKRSAAQEAAQKAAIDKAVGRSNKRAPALEKAKIHAAMRRAQVPRSRGGAVALTREEKRMKRMANEMGVSFKVQRNAPPPKMNTNMAAKPNVPSTSTSVAGQAPPKRLSAREKFILEERQRKLAKQAAAHVDDEDVDEYDSMSDMGSEDEGDAPAHASIRDEIWKLFGRDRQRYVDICMSFLIQRYMARDVDSDDDMEAGADDVLEEERRSSMFGRREDEREEQMLLESKRRKFQGRP